MGIWQAFEEDVPDCGRLVRGEEVVNADLFGALWSLLVRDCNFDPVNFSKISR